MPSPSALLRKSLSAVGTRFHLVGLFTLSSLLVRIAVHWMGEDGTWFPLVAAAIVLYIACAGGVLGMLFQAATETRVSPSFFHWATHLLMPITWLWLTIYLVVFGPSVHCCTASRAATTTRRSSSGRDSGERVLRNLHPALRCGPDSPRVRHRMQSGKL